ncbi:MAG: hypothetical protein EA398_00265 [Deltaproteobacteria bacterium]|nr:MAG: hypothetical protein EA398_00265 [Deltaproteobacteria bacterium]
MAEAQLEGTLRAGVEADDNPGRSTAAPEGFSAGARVFGELHLAERPTRNLDLGVTARAGGRWNAGATDATGGAAEASGRARLWLTRSVDWRVRGSWRERAERSGDRDYRLLVAATGPGAWIGEHHATLEGGVERFVFHPQPDASSTGGMARGALRLRLAESLVLPVEGSVRSRATREEALGGPTVPGEEPGGLSEDASDRRRDLMLGVGAGLEWEATRALLEVRWRYAHNDSTAFARSWRRHVVDASVTVLPVGELLVRGAVVVQRTRWPDRRLDDETIFLEDENRNQFSLTLEHPVAGPVFGEVRVTHHRQAFGADEVDDYRRTVLYGGLAWWF